MGQLAYLVPGMVVYGVGLFLLLSSRSRLGRAAVLGILGCAVLLFTQLAGTIVHTWVMQSLSRGTSTVAMLAMVGMLQNFLHFLGIGLLIAAILARSSSR